MKLQFPGGILLMIVLVVIVVIGRFALVDDRANDISEVGYPSGSSDAPVTVVEFSDFGCPHCGAFMHTALPHIRNEYIDRGVVRWVHVPLLLGTFPGSNEAASAAACAGEQGELIYWAMHDQLFANQRAWASASERNEVFMAYARAAGADESRFRECLASERPAAALDRFRKATSAVGVRIAPTFVVNGRLVEGALPLAQFRGVLDEAARR